MKFRNMSFWMIAFALLAVAGLGSMMIQAATGNDIAYIDMQKISSSYLQPLMEKPLEQELSKLQAEFDSKAKNMSDQAKAELFNTYQARLNAREQELLTANLAKVRTAAEQVVKSTGYKVVLDADAVVTGGTDITSLVLTKLKAMK